jgi:hypothetical protein
VSTYKWFQSFFSRVLIIRAHNNKTVLKEFATENKN